jgi:hypothetical protein
MGEWLLRGRAGYRPALSRNRLTLPSRARRQPRNREGVEYGTVTDTNTEGGRFCQLRPLRHRELFSHFREHHRGISAFHLSTRIDNSLYLRRDGVSVKALRVHAAVVSCVFLLLQGITIRDPGSADGSQTLFQFLPFWSSP